MYREKQQTAEGNILEGGPYVSLKEGTRKYFQCIRGKLSKKQCSKRQGGRNFGG